MTTPDLPLGRLSGLTEPFIRFARHEWTGGVILLLCAIIAIAAANSGWAAAWQGLWHTPVALALGGWRVDFDVAHGINDGLMVLFFLLVGLEIKREVVCGELSTPRKALLPIGAAVGGMLAPALIYAALNQGTPTAHGWGIPTATDIAFALGIMRLVPGRIPAALFVFLTALAIADDLGAVLVIALFYSHGLDLGALLAVALTFLALIGLNRLGVRAGFVYAIGGFILWAATLASGIHATVAGVLLALTIPIRVGDDHGSTLHRWEHIIQPWSTFLIIPLFALANAGVAVGGALAPALRDPLFWGVAAGLLLGKPIGITALSWLLVRLRLAALPEGVTWRQVAAVSMLGGIGFTMSLFINSLAFSDPHHIDTAKLGIIGGSACAAILGALACALVMPRKHGPP